MDENGTITAVGKGSANVRAICKKGAERVSSSFDVAVSEEGLYTTDAVYTTDGTVALSSFAASPQVQVTGVEGAVFNGDSFTLTEEEAWVTVAYNGIEDRILLQRVANKELLLENAASYKKGVWAKEGFVTLGTSHFAVNVISNLGAERLDVQWSSSAPSVARVENGRIVGVSYGRAVLTASKEGYADLTIPVFVVEKMGDINLKFDALNDKAGLAERRVFGVYTCDKNLQVTDHLHLDIATTYPTHLKDYAEFDNLVEYIVDDPTLASVDENGFISFSRAAIGKTVTVTVKSLYSDNKAKDSYTFHIVDGINVGVGVEAYYDKTVSTEYPDFDPYNEFRYVMETYVGDYEDNGVLGCVVCQSNVYLPPEKAPYWKWDDEVRLNRPIEGNGFVLDGQLHCDEYDDHLFRSGLDCSRLIEMCGEDYELVVNNLFIQSYAPISDDSEEAFKDLKVRGGTSYRMDSANTSLKNLEVTFRFCNFRYAYIHLNPASGVINLDGCIFSNSAGPAIMHYGGRDDSTEVVVNNCIFSNTISPVYLSTRGNIGLEKTDDNIYKYTILRLTGENYIYNWKLIDEVQMDIFPSVDDDKMLNSLIAALNQQVTGYLKEVLSDSSNKQYVYKQIKGDYVNFACVTLGIWADHQMKINPTDPTVLEEMGEKRSTMFFDENKWYAGELDMSKMQDIIFSKKLYKAALTAMGVDLVNKKSYLVIPRNKDGKYNTQPDETYHIDEKTKKRLRGEG